MESHLVFSNEIISNMLKLKIVSPEKVVFDDAVENVIVPGTLGQFEILENHAPIISTLENGNVTYKTKTDNFSLKITGGFVTVQKNQDNICVELL